jgi:hypothetical protein
MKYATPAMMALAAYPHLRRRPSSLKADDFDVSFDLWSLMVYGRKKGEKRKG